MGQQVSVTKLKEQIEVAKRSLAEMSPVNHCCRPFISACCHAGRKFCGLAVEREDDAPDARGQNMAPDDMATGDMATGEDFQFFHRPKRLDRPFASSSPISMANADISPTVTISRFFRRSINGLIGLKMILRRTKNISSN